MTAREMIDSLSGTLLCDERILSVPERELLANLLQRTRIQVSASENAVAEAITRTVGEIIAERALGVLGESMTRQLLQQQLGSSTSLNRNLPVIRAGSPPTTPPPPSPGSRPPGPARHRSALALRRLRRRVRHPTRHARPAPVRRQSVPALRRLVRRGLLLRTRDVRRAQLRRRSHSRPPPCDRRREESPSSKPTITCPLNAWFSTSS